MHVTENRRTIAYRLLEILPAALSLGSFVVIVILSFVAPIVVASAVLVYVIWWFCRSLVMSIHLVVGYRAYRQATKINWRQRLETNPNTRDRWQKVWHLIIVANAKEELPIVRATLESLTKSDYPLDRLIVVVANEAAYSEVAAVNQPALEKEFGKQFDALWMTTHPKNIPNEVRGKGANISYAAHAILPELRKRHFDPINVLVTTLDADHRPHPQYFAAVTWAHLHDPEPALKTYQPLPMFFNNIWSVPLVIRSISIGSSFWQMIEATRPYRLRNFAAQTQSLAILEKTDFWSNQTTVEDGHQYWRSYFATNGKHEAVPIFIPIYQDAVLSPDGDLMTYREQYLQKRRWAWGVSDVPFVLTNLWKGRKRLPLRGWVQAGRLIEGHYSWAATSLILAFFGWLPIILNPGFRDTVLAFNFGVIYQRLLTLAMSGMLVTLIISRLMLPPRPKKRALRSNYLLEWVLTPFFLPAANIIFGSLPAIDAQLRLAFGRYLGFRVTEKAVDRLSLTHAASHDLVSGS